MRTVIIHNGVEYRAYDHLYAVSKNGQVIKIATLSPGGLTVRRDGYISVGRRRLLHRMVATCWLDKPEAANEVHHRNEDKSMNAAENLQWVTRLEHAAHHQWGRQPMSMEAREKLRDYRTGRKASEETKQKQREAAIRLGCTPPPRPVGYKCSDVAIAKMSENSPNAVKCEIDGVIYSSFSAAGEALGVKPHTLRKRCYSSSFGDYRLVKG